MKLFKTIDKIYLFCILAKTYKYDIITLQRSIKISWDVRHSCYFEPTTTIWESY